MPTRFNRLSHLARRFLVPLFCLLAGGCSPPPQLVVAVPGSVVSLAPPAGFELAPNFSGFVSEDGRSSILIAELPGEASDSVSTLFADEATARERFLTQGVRVERLESLSVDGRVVPVAVGNQTAHGHTFDKWMAFFSGSPAVLVTLQATAERGLTHKEAMRVLASVRLRQPATIEAKLSELPFTATAVAPFRRIDTLAGSAMLFTAGPLDADPEGRQPLVVVASQLSLPFNSDDLAEVSDQLIAGTVKIKGGTVVSRSEVEFAGIRGYRVDGIAPEGSRYRHYLALWPGERFVRLAAILPTGSGPEVEEAVDAMAASVHFKE